MLREGRNSFRDRKAAALAVISAKYRPFPPMSSALSEGLGMRTLAAPVLRGGVGTVVQALSWFHGEGLQLREL